jgi:hypothetical protein
VTCARASKLCSCADFTEHGICNVAAARVQHDPQQHCHQVFQGKTGVLLSCVQVFFFVPPQISFVHQIFPIMESTVQHLRVKLVSLKKAAAGSSFRSDVLAPGRTMLEIASNNKNIDELRSYDPSLFLLVQWMLSDEAITMAEVLRHPYFMSPSERQTFAIAMGGGMIANYMQGAAHAAGIRAIREAIQPSLDECLARELSRLFEQTRVAGAAAPPGSCAPAAAIASSLDTRAVQPRGASLEGGTGGGAAVAEGGGGAARAATTTAAVRTITAAATTATAAAAAAASVGGGSAAGGTPAANGQYIAPPRIEINRNPASAHANPLQLTADMRSYSSFADRARVFQSMTTGPNAVSPSQQAVTILLAAPDAGLHLQTVLDITRALPDPVLCCHDILVKALPMCAEHNDTVLLRRLWGVGANGLRDSKLGWSGIGNPGVHYCISKLVRLQAREHASQGRGWAMLLSLLQAESVGGGGRAPEGEWPALAAPAPRRGGLGGAKSP